MKRILTSFPLIPLGFYLIFWADYWVLFAGVAVFAGLCYREYCRIGVHFGGPPMSIFGLAAGLALLAVQSGEMALISAILILAAALQMRVEPVLTALPRAAVFLFGLIYVFGSWHWALRIRSVSPYWLCFAVVLNWVSDISAYYTGRKFGSRKLAPRVSPGKTWEGTIGSLLITTPLAVLYLNRFLPDVPLAEAIALSVATNVIGQFGDLFESGLKRGAGMKDSGTLLPGHGGALDRFDSTLFTLPAVYTYLQYWRPI